MEDSVYVRESRNSVILSDLGTFPSRGYPEMPFHIDYDANFADPAPPRSPQTSPAYVGRRQEKTRERGDMHEGRQQSALRNELVLERRGDVEVHERTRQSAFRNDGVFFSEHAIQESFPIPQFRPSALGASEASHSVRLGRDGVQNITQRDSKHPKERTRDQAYKKRFSMGSSVPSYGSPRDLPLAAGNHPWPREAGFSSPSPQPVMVFNYGLGDGGSQPRGAMPFGHPPSGLHQDGYSRPPIFGTVSRSLSGPDPRPGLGPSPVSPNPPSSGPVRGAVPPGPPHDPGYIIHLVFEGAVVACRVRASTSVAQLRIEAAQIFGLDHDHLILVLFSSAPTSLPREGFLSGPPVVGPGARVMVFYVTPSHWLQRQGAHRPEPREAPPPPDMTPIPHLNSKLLASFKLPNFDGVARSWKLWEKSFQRFLGLHQLDHVLEEDFLDMLWDTPGAKAANKMVFFLIEDAVASGTLASKLVRQATKWNGHEAFVLLRNGYVFNGPQTATILLAELSKIRLLRDEDASSFCLRLVELIEDLELVPGEAAVYLTETQKLGYLLSAIRHETGLQAVYAQLQSDQLNGTITFEQACRQLHHRVESMKADDLMDGWTGRALISLHGRKEE